MASSSRAEKLARFFRDVLAGKRGIKDKGDASLFLEAAVAHKSPETCIEALVSRHHGAEAVQKSVRADLSLAFLQTRTLPFVQILSSPEVALLADGHVLRQVLLWLVDPPMLWRRVVQLLLDDAAALSDHDLFPLAWLASETSTVSDKAGVDVLPDLQAIVAYGRLRRASDHTVRAVSCRIEKIVRMKTALDVGSPSAAPGVVGDPFLSPGGRHDNDFANFRDIAIFPTNDELLSQTRPFYRCADAVFQQDLAERAAVHIDNQFRLLREDMLAEIRDDIQVALGKKKGRRRLMFLGDLTLIDLDLGDIRRGKECALTMVCGQGLDELRRLKVGVARQEFLASHKNYIKHQALGIFVQNDAILAFAFLERDVARLANTKDPVVCMRFPDTKALYKMLLLLHHTNQNVSAPIHFVLAGTTVFGHEPVLQQLKHMVDLPLEHSLVNPSQPDGSFAPIPRLEKLANELREKAETGENISTHHWLDGHPVRHLEKSQLDSVVNSLSRPVSVIQGPPGTGKSFIGALIAKIVHQKSEQKILVISYTNHALDQFLEDLLDAGIPEDDMTRLGSKSTARTMSMLMSRQELRFRHSHASGVLIDTVKKYRDDLRDQIKHDFEEYARFVPTFTDILEHLEFDETDSHFHDAFLLPADEDGWVRIGKNSRSVATDYLYVQWAAGRGPGRFAKYVLPGCRAVWTMSVEQRRACLTRWHAQVLQGRAEAITDLVHKHNRAQNEVDALFRQGQTALLRGKRVLACTTTAAAMHPQVLHNAKPDIVLVEEAGEILECHVLAALSSSVRQLILIGDHKQLRPRYSNYALTVEKGDGYDFNMSLFERLIRQGCPYTTLHTQHRMHPDIALFPRVLTYPELRDGPTTGDHPGITGMQDRVVFVHHEHPETQLDNAIDRRDPEAKATKQNQFEADMCLRIVRYLAQQGYNTSDIVVLTPYLGQLRLFLDMMADESDPVLNDLDAAQLIQAGLMTEAASKVNKEQLRISTIDNYQGEESDIVVASLTRSNDRGDIGFLSAAERLNVLITRARNGIILIGNMKTLMASQRGTLTWTPFFELMRDGGHLYDGFPVLCERHPHKRAILRTPEDFDSCCPDGGCATPCDVMLPCTVHKCKRRCHRIDNHSQVQCTESITKTCERGHKQEVQCSQREARCKVCVEEDKEQERIIRRNLKLEEERLARQKAYAQELQMIQDEIAHERRLMMYRSEKEDQERELAQKKADLEALRNTAKHADAKLSAKKARDAKSKRRADQKTKEAANGDENDGENGDNLLMGVPSNAQEEWEDMKKTIGADSKPLDELMKMVGLEEVKQAFLEIKNVVDTKLRQGLSLDAQRFGCSLLGNPGTGKTTVAWLYAQFLFSVGAIPGSRFEETTGAKLAQGGVSGSQQLIDDVLNDGGGVVFIDEAYQLTSGNSPGGKAVLDYLLPVVENLTGKVVFVLAGYDKEMESFFAHNPGLPSRFPQEMKFADYSDGELLHILGGKIDKEYDGAMACEGGVDGLFVRIVARRIGRGRGRPGFGNARTVENTLAAIAKRQAVRLKRERRAGQTPDDFLMTKEDIIGPEPAGALKRSSGWRKLSELIGLAAVKEAVQSLLDSVQQNYQRELVEEAPIEYTLNKVFVGNPGTGKTTVAKLYGQVLADIGLLSKGEVVVKNPSDFVGSALGESERLTKGILAATVGKVLVIDEAYGLYDGAGNGGGGNFYKTAVIDTIVAEVQGVAGDDRCVLLLGYKDQLETMFHNVNPGLARRFPMATAFKFEDFDDDDLRRILELKLQQQSYKATDQAKRVVLAMLNRARNRPNFGNAGEIDILLNAAKAQHQVRRKRSKQQGGQGMASSVLEAVDFDPDFDRAERSETNVQKLFEGTVGADHIVAMLEGYQETVRTMKALDLDPKDSIPFNFIFRGPPGTGKTTTARKMGKVFYDMGFLATAEVVECSASDLVGQYVGQTGPKVVQQLDRALGRVLFVDEAYRLAPRIGGSYAQEALDELVDCTTKTRYHKKLVIILAGYEGDMNQLLSANEGLTSRFPETIDFASLAPPDCVKLLEATLAVQKRSLAAKKMEFDLSVLSSSSSSSSNSPDFSNRLRDAFAALAAQPGWANSRDVQTLGRSIFGETIKCKTDLEARRLVLREATVLDAVAALLTERTNRATKTRARLGKEMPIQPSTLAEMFAETPRLLPKTTATSTATATATASATTTTMTDSVGQDEANQVAMASKPPTQTKAAATRESVQRDAGVSDAVWEQLQRDRQAERDREAAYQKLRKARDTAASEAARAKIVERLVEEERLRQEEAARLAKIAAMGMCPIGYAWIRQDTGYRCAGGSHFMSNDQLG